ncbi:MAG: hypothetical protein AAFX81_00900 [Pseudomonadota bacterium]
MSPRRTPQPDLIGRAALDPPTTALEGDELLAVVRATLATASGRALLDHLARRFVDRSLSPSASDAELRHLDGQRSVVLLLRHLVATARRAPTGEPAS